MLKFLENARIVRKHAENLYVKIVQQSRLKQLYEHFSIPDNIDGRYEMLTFHTWLFLRRLRSVDDPLTTRISQRIFDQLVHDFDLSLREIGLGDKKLAKQVRFMVKGVYGRLHAYDQAFGNDELMRQALQRNLLSLQPATGNQIQMVNRYVLDTANYLDEINQQLFLKAGFDWPLVRTFK